MLIYANRFLFIPQEGPEEIIRLVAKWVGQGAGCYVDPVRLAEGNHRRTLRDGSMLSSRTTVFNSDQVSYPYLFSAQWSGRRNKGRKWVTEVGLRQEDQKAAVECSLLLKTDEISARVTSPIQVTRPKLVEQLINACNPMGQTPGLILKRLTEENASAFLSEVEREGRSHPLVLISPGRDGAYPVDPERLRSILVGLADLIDVPASQDTFAIQDMVGRRYMAFGGAINIVFPARKRDHRDWFCETVRIRPDDISEMVERGTTVESEVLGAITHRTNVPYSWKHISREIVDQAILRTRLARMIEREKGADRSAEVAEHIALFEEADKELKAKDDEVALIRAAYDEKDQESRKLQADIANLKHALRGQQANDDGHREVAEELGLLRESVTSVLKGNPRLQQALDLISLLYAGRVVILDSARSAAKESDKGGFRQGAKAYELLSKLATDYWQTLAEGGSDQQAKAVFGQTAYSANESCTLSNDGKRRRTFPYRGRDFLMEKHLKHGVKDSVAETLRVHFMWLANEKKILIGHCGRHLDF